MTKQLEVADKLSFPSSVVTQTIGVLAVRGAGKTNACRVMAEEMYEAGLPFVAIDPVGSWWGLRSTRDGKKPGLAIPIFGGKHGDVPIGRDNGAVLAELIAAQSLSCVVDVSEFDSEAAKKQFLLEFAKKLFQKNEAPLHLFLEEADDYIPQRPMRDEAQLLRAWENIVKRGRARGLGITLLTQRSAAINKNVLTQIETLIALRTTSPQDRDAIEAWLKYNNQSQEILESLPKLENGEAWVWSPNFLKETKRVKFRLSHTFDSGQTPKSAAKAAATLADVDLAAIEKKMAVTIERAKADDPRELRKQIAELKRELSAQGKQVEVQRVEVPVLDEAVFNALQEGCHGELSNLSGALNTAQSVIAEAIRVQRKRCKAVAERAVRRAMLTALAQPPDGLTKRPVLIHTGYASSGPVSTAFADLAREGYVEGDGNRLWITRGGRRELGPFEPLPLGDDLREWLLEGDKLNRMERALLSAICAAYPSAISKGDVLQKAEYASSGPVSTAFAKLVAYGYAVPQGAAMLKAAEKLFS